MSPPPADASPARPRRRSARALRATLLLLVLLALAGAGYAAWKQFYAPRNPNEQYLTATVQRGDIDDLVTATGTVQPRDYVDVGAQVNGQLKVIKVEVGSVVQKGDLLAEIDAAVFQANVDGRRASLRNQQATMKDKQAQLVLAQLQFERQKRLNAEDATTTEQLQTADATLRSTQAQIEALKASIDQIQSSLRADEATLSYSRIYAPMSGTVVSITARQGQTLNTNQSAPTVLRIADLSTVTVQTQVSEADVSRLRGGMPVYFTTLGSQGRRWWGQLRKVEPTPTVTNNVVLYNALFDVPNPNNALMTSMTAQVFFVAAAAKDVLVVPAAAVTVTGGSARGDRARREGRGASAPRGAGDAGLGAEGGGRVKPAAGAEAGRPPMAASASADGASAPGERRMARRERPPGDAGGAVDSARPRAGTAKVIDAQGVISERPVELGISNRVQVQVLKGLAEGEQVIAGLRPAAPRSTPGQQQQRSGLQQGPGGLPPGGPGGR